MVTGVMMMRSIAHRVRYAYPRWKYLRVAARGTPMAVRLPKGITIRLYPWGQIAESISIYGFERTELALTASLLKEGMNVIDIGANIGLYSLLASQLVGSSGHIWSFEPSSQTYAHLLMNLSLNSCDSVTAIQSALCDRSDGKILLKRSSGCSDAERYVDLYPNHPSGGHEPMADPGDDELVDVTSLDSYARRHLGGKRIDFVKIDVEGCEYAVLQGAVATLEANPGVVILFECSWQGCQWAGRKTDDVFALLESHGFSLFCWSRRMHGWESSRESLRTAGNIWACRYRSLLPSLP